MRGVSCLRFGVAQRRPEGRSAVPLRKTGTSASEPSPCVGAAFLRYSASGKPARPSVAHLRVLNPPARFQVKRWPRRPPRNAGILRP